MAAVPQVFLRILSDRHLRPAAVRLLAARAGGIDAALSHPGLPPLLATIPCYLTAEDAAVLSPETADAFVALGGHVAASGQVEVRGSAHPEALPAAARLICSDWYMQPLVQPAVDRAGSRALALRLAQLVANDADTPELEAVFRQAPALSYHLLRVVNSPAIGAGRRITSFSQALLVLGRKQLRRWLNLILFASRDDDPRGPMLLARVLIRSCLLESLSREAGDDREGQERAFMAGMFSLLGIMFGLPLDGIIGPLRLGTEVEDALLSRAGELGALLALVEAIEIGDAERLDKSPVTPAGNLDQLQIDAYLWMLAVLGDARGEA